MASDPMPHAAVICINKKRPQNANGDRFVGLPLCPKMLLLLIDILTGTPTNPTPLPAPPSLPLPNQLIATGGCTQQQEQQQQLL